MFYPLGAGEGLLLDLRNAISKAKKENVTVRKQNVQIKNGNGNGGHEYATDLSEADRRAIIEYMKTM